MHRGIILFIAIVNKKIILSPYPNRCVAMECLNISLFDGQRSPGPVVGRQMSEVICIILHLPFYEPWLCASDYDLHLYISNDK